MRTTVSRIEQDAENLRANVARLLATRKLQAVAHSLGVERATVARWRAGSRKVDSGYLPSLARYLKVSVDDLFAPVDPE
jgi:transcriptional regulator with XRE-family HTH domain